MKRKNDNSGKTSQSKKTTSAAPKSKTPALNDLIEQNCKLAEENLIQARETRKATILQTIVRLADPSNNKMDYDEIERLVIELQILSGIDPTLLKPNHCKTCLFQKLCPQFTKDGRNGLQCSYPDYQKSMMETLKKGKGWVSYNQTLVYWNDTQKQLDARFILS